MGVQRYVLPSGAVRYRARVKWHGRYVATRVFERKADAVAWDQDQRRRLRLGEWIDPRRGQVPLSVVAADGPRTLHPGLAAGRMMGCTHSTQIIPLCASQLGGYTRMLHCGSITLCDRPRTRKPGCGGTASARRMAWARSPLLCRSTLSASAAEPHVLAIGTWYSLHLPGSVGSLSSETRFRARRNP
jgi:hypothetical protein